jgi:antitoxin (DNA-binding transcriptional repressor) of toxin-antitoxin stability system
MSQLGSFRRANLSPKKRAACGEEIPIAKNGKPVARLTRLSSRKSTDPIGAFAGKLHMADDFGSIPAELGPYL